MSVSPTNGTATIITGPKVMFHPSSNFVGVANVRYSISDGHGGTASALITINVTTAKFGILAGTPVFNPQTGLLEQHVTVTNNDTNTVSAVRLLVGGMPAGAKLYNCTGTNSGRPYVQNNASLAPGQAVEFMLEFYAPDRHTFSDNLEAQAIEPVATVTTQAQGVIIDKFFPDTRIPGQPRFVIEFATVPGHTYTVLYSEDMQTWKAATPSFTANANRTQWYDDGPPKTESKPLSGGSRCYRVVSH
jgi:hypothetical protein